MDIIECPHCLTRVVPTGDRLCPACHKDPYDTSGLDLARTRIRVTANQPLPEICFNCARPSSLWYTVRQACNEPLDADPGKATALFALLMLLNPLELLLPRKREVLAVELPICQQCANTEKPKPERFDYTAEWMTFTVHREFKKAVNSHVSQE